jgi:hypothetical protein
LLIRANQESNAFVFDIICCLNNLMKKCSKLLSKISRSVDNQAIYNLGLEMACASSVLDSCLFKEIKESSASVTFSLLGSSLASSSQPLSTFNS